MDILERYRGIISEAKYPFVIEFGACDGYHSDLLLRDLEMMRKPFIFHTFEPNKDLHPQILDNIKGHLVHNAGLIALFPVAIGVFNEEAPFYKSGGQKTNKQGEVTDHYYGSSSILPPKLVKKSYPQMTFTEERVHVRSLDRHINICQLEGSTIDFIWCDIQGAEAALIQGGFNTFQHVRYLYTEYDNAESYAGQKDLKGILELLPGFEIVEDYGGDVLLKNKTL